MFSKLSYLKHDNTKGIQSEYYLLDGVRLV